MLEPTSTTTHVPYYRPSTLTQELGLVVTELGLRIYHCALTVLSSVLSCFQISYKALDDHIFTIHVLKEYAGAEFSNLVLQEEFADFLKVPMFNMPKVAHVLEGADLYWARRYLQAFITDDVPRLLERHIDSFISDSEEDIAWKQSYLQDPSNCQQIVDKLPKESDLQHPLKGVCQAVVLKIFQKLGRPNARLEDIAAKYRCGAGKKTAGLHSFYKALCGMFLARRAQEIIKGNHPFSLVCERIGLKEIGSRELLSEGGVDQEFVEKVCLIEEGCYEVSLNVFDVLDRENPRPTTAHALFMRKQGDDLEIVDPNIGLLQGASEERTRELVQKILSLYLKDRKILLLQFRKLEH